MVDDGSGLKTAPSLCERVAGAAEILGVTEGASSGGNAELTIPAENGS